MPNTRPRRLAVLVALFTATAATHHAVATINFGTGEIGLLGDALGTEENFVGAPGDYIAPDTTTNDPLAGGQMIGMTESLRLDPLAGAPDGSIHLGQPAVLPVTDPRSGIDHPVLGAPRWRPRLGALGRADFVTPDQSPPVELTPGDPQITVQLFNLNEVGSFSLFAPALDDGEAPGSVAADGIHDTVPLADLGGGIMGVSIIRDYFGPSHGPDFLGGILPPALTPRVSIFEDSGSSIDLFTPPLDEVNFDHNAGNNSDGGVTEWPGDAPDGTVTGPTGITGGEIDDGVDGTVLLTGVLDFASASISWTETAPGSGEFVMDIFFSAFIEFDGGSLLPQIDPDQNFGEITAFWEDIPFPDSTAVIPGTDVNTLPIYDFDDFGLHGASLEDANFSIGFTLVPEPGTALVIVCMSAPVLTRRRTRV